MLARAARRRRCCAWSRVSRRRWPPATATATLSLWRHKPSQDRLKAGRLLVFSPLALVLAENLAFAPSELWIEDTGF